MDRQELQGSKNPVSGGVVVKEDNMARLFPTQFSLFSRMAAKTRRSPLLSDHTSPGRFEGLGESQVAL